MAGCGKGSRRALLTKLMLLIASASVITPKARSAAEGKVSKSVAHYQDNPKGGQTCGMCKYFQGHGMMNSEMMGNGMMGHGMGHGMTTGECQVVEGQISMMGWCQLYSSRGS